MKQQTTGAEKRSAGKRRPAADAGQCARLGRVIRQYRLAAGLGQAELASGLGISKTAVGNWELGLARPDLSTVPRLCAALSLPVTELLGMQTESALSGEDRAVLDAFHHLDRYDRDTVLQLMARLRFQQDRREEDRLRDAYLPLCLYEDAAAAGIGTPMQDRAEDRTVYVLSSRVPSGTNGLIHVNGRSMEPVFPDGSYVYVDTAAPVLPGQVGIFIVNGESFIKRYQPDGLYSINPRYRPILFGEGTDIRLFGRVTGPAEENDIAAGPLAEKIRAAFDSREE